MPVRNVKGTASYADDEREPWLAMTGIYGDPILPRRARRLSIGIQMIRLFPKNPPEYDLSNSITASKEINKSRFMIEFDTEQETLSMSSRLVTSCGSRSRSAHGLKTQPFSMAKQILDPAKMKITKGETTNDRARRRRSSRVQLL